MALLLGALAGAILVILAEQIRTPLEAIRSRSIIDRSSSAINLRTFQRKLEETQAQSGSGNVGLGLIQLDGLRDLMENLPSVLSEKVLHEVTHLLRNELRGNDIVGRWSDVEFAVMLPSTPLNAAEKTIDRIRLALSEPICIEQSNDSVCLEPYVSVAVSQPQEPVLDLIDRAEKTLLQARRTHLAESSTSIKWINEMTTDRSVVTIPDSPQSLPQRDWLPYALVLFAMVLGVTIALAVGQVGIFALLMIPAILIIAGSFIQPDLGLLALLFVVYINLSDVFISFHNLPSVVQPLVGLVFGVIFVRGFFYKEKYTGWAKPLILLGFYTFLSSFALFYASDFTQANITLSSFLKDVVISILVVVLIQKPGSLKRAVWALLFAGILMGSISIIQQITQTYTNLYWGFGQTVLATGNYRSEGPIGDGNFYAQMMVVLLPLAADRFWHEKSAVLRSFALLAFVISTLTVVFTYSRGGFIALVFVVALIFLSRSIRFSQLILVLALLLIGAQLLPSGYIERISTLGTFLPGSQDHRHRFFSRTHE